VVRGEQKDQGALFNYVHLEDRIPAEHPLRKIRVLVDRALGDLDKQFEELYSATGRPSIPPERLLRALLLQYLCGVRSERLLMEQLDYNLLCFSTLSGCLRFGGGSVCRHERVPVARATRGVAT